MTDEQLAGLAGYVLDGDHQAFERLYNETIGNVYRTLYMLTGSPRDAEDVAQEVYLELYRNIRKYDGSRSFRNWMYGIVVRQHSSFKRKRWREFRKEQKERERHSNEAVAKPVSARSQDATDDVMDNLDQLPDKLKQVLVLRYINDLSQQDIADALHIPVGTVKSRLSQALRRMRQMMGRDLHGESFGR